MGEIERAFRALSDERRRLVVSCVQEHQSVTLPDVAEHVAEREEGRSIADISEEHVRDVYFSLYHTHVPTLEEADLARYEQERDVVARTGDVQKSLARARDRVDSLLKDP